MELKYAYGIVPGISGSRPEAECKDTIKIVRENGVAVVFLAGSKGESAADVAAALVTNRFDELYSSDEEFIKTEILGNSIGVSGRECGLLFVAVKDNHYLAGHLGGGLIARLNGICEVLCTPEAEAQDRSNLRVYQGDLQEPFGFMLMSEGACQSLYENSTGSLSPACGTFFEWLKEYDEETVSEALTENINKYFLKNTENDISVAVMVTDKPTKENGHSRNRYKYLIVALVVLAVFFACTWILSDLFGRQDTTQEESKPPVINSANHEPSVTFAVDHPESFDAGEYQIGADIPAGEYFFWTGEMLKPDSVDVNDFTCLSDELYCMTIQVKDGDTLYSSVRFTVAENVNPVEAAGGILISGKYKIGKDIAPGTYTVRPAEKGTEGRYYSILNDAISNDTRISEETTVVVPERGYVTFYNAVMFLGTESIQ